MSAGHYSTKPTRVGLNIQWDTTYPICLESMGIPEIEWNEIITHLNTSLGEEQKALLYRLLVPLVLLLISIPIFFIAEGISAGALIGFAVANIIEGVWVSLGFMMGFMLLLFLGIFGIFGYVVYVLIQGQSAYSKWVSDTQTYISSNYERRGLQILLKRDVHDELILEINSSSQNTEQTI